MRGWPLRGVKTVLEAHRKGPETPEAGLSGAEAGPSSAAAWCFALLGAFQSVSENTLSKRIRKHPKTLAPPLQAPLAHAFWGAREAAAEVLALLAAPNDAGALALLLPLLHDSSWPVDTCPAAPQPAPPRPRPHAVASPARRRL